MPGKKGGKGGKKARRGKKTGGNASEQRRMLTSDGPQQRYAQALKMLGDRRIQANVYNPQKNVWEEKLIHVRGKFRKRVWINVGDYVLVSTRDFESGANGLPLSGLEDDDKLQFGGDVIHKYEAPEVKKLVKMGEFPLEDDDSEDLHDRFDFVSDDSDEDPFGEDKPPRPEVAPQQRKINIPSSDSEDSVDVEKMTKAELEAALDDL